MKVRKLIRQKIDLPHGFCIRIDGVTEKSYKEIVLVVPAAQENPEQKRVIGLIRGKGAWVEQENMNGGYLGKAGIILIVSEAE